MTNHHIETENIINVLLIDDDSFQHLFVKSLLSVPSIYKFNYHSTTTLIEAWEYMSSNKVDILLLDLCLKESNGKDTFEQSYSRFPNIPIVIFTGNNNDKLGLELVNMGAQDYLIKEQVSAILLIRSIIYAVERHSIIQKLNNAIDEIKTLNGLLPICASCKKIRDDKGYWNVVEKYIEDRSLAKFTHGICPDCIRKIYPSLKMDD
jgi:DNA-binding NtrC family response regulator